MQWHLGVVKVVFLSASGFPADFTKAAGLHVTQHQGLCRVGHQKAVLVHIDALHLMLKPGLQHYAGTCSSCQCVTVKPMQGRWEHLSGMTGTAAHFLLQTTAVVQSERLAKAVHARSAAY